MENSEQKQKRKVVKPSVILSFVASIIAVFSLVVVGITTIQNASDSYAISVTGDQFDFYFRTDPTSSDGESFLIKGITGSGKDDAGFEVPMLYSDAALTNPIFCIEHIREIGTSRPGEPFTYVKGNAIDDYGLLYILNNSYVNEKNIYNGDEYIETWTTQVAIWLYLYNKYPGSSSVHYFTSEELNYVRNVRNLTVPDESLGERRVISLPANYYSTYITPLLDRANEASRTKKLTVKAADDNVYKTDDGNYYRSSLITVTGNPASDLIDYDITLRGIDGAVAIGEDGNVLNTTGVPAGTKFYVRIPKDKVTVSVQTVTVSVTGRFNSLEGTTYELSPELAALETDQYQKVVSVTGTVTSVNDGTTIDFVGAPDTGMNAVQTIYFIGLVILLCGIGIVYANAKPVQVKQ